MCRLLPIALTTDEAWGWRFEEYLLGNIEPHLGRRDRRRRLRHTPMASSVKVSARASMLSLSCPISNVTSPKPSLFMEESSMSQRTRRHHSADQGSWRGRGCGRHLGAVSEVATATSTAPLAFDPFPFASCAALWPLAIQALTSPSHSSRRGGTLPACGCLPSPASRNAVDRKGRGLPNG